ncbi:MAG: Do family serine endopeptidase [Flavobacteriales bacterium]|nr:Do family serine endopeptidase [Flavobacteriales bacterium]MBL0034340.1 Do family serine endopeptidase [Flavobacteriales bacterium]
MKRTLSYLAVGLAGGLLALGIHDRYLSPSRPLENVVASASTSLPARFVNLPGPGGTIVAAPDFTDAAERTVNAVVHVTTEAMVQQSDPFAQFFWGYRAPAPQPMRGAGSGVIISDDGFIVTNNHVVEGADKIQVHLNDKRQFDATVIGRDPSTDLALIKVDAKDLPAITYANSDAVKVGEWVLAVGNPMNLTSTVTAGIVSAKARNINLLQYNPDQDIFPIESFIQTDAAVNPGNSGGALVNTSGELVGINSAIASTTGAYSGYSFAIPANIVRKVTGDLMEFGAVQRAYIGVSIGDVDQELAAQLAMDRIRGVYVKDITSDGAAEAGGMKAGDVILKVGNMDVNNVPQLQEQVGRFRPGDKVAVTVLRKGEESVLDLTLRGREGNTKVVERKEEATAATLLGAQLVKATAEEMRALKISNGVKVKSLSGGKLRSSGIREGFIITSIDQQPIREPEDVGNALGSKRGGVLIEGVYPNGMKAYYGLGI